MQYYVDRKSFRFPWQSLQGRIFLVVIAISIISVAAGTYFIRKFFRDYIVEINSRTVMDTAVQAANDPTVIAGFDAPDPIVIIKPIAEKYRQITGTSFVVVFNMDTIRYSHPNPEMLGQHFVGGDEQAALRGESYISTALGTLGLSIRAFVPIRNSRGDQIGVVSVGMLLDTLSQEMRRISSILILVDMVSLALGLFGAFFLSRNIKNTIFGLEPYEIAALLEERDVIISSVKEGIVAIDRHGTIILMNDSAKRILDIDGMFEGHKVADVIPNTKLPEVLQTGNPHLDEEILLNKCIVLANRYPLISQGNIIGAVASFRDLSEVRALAEQLTEVHKYIDALRSQHHEFLNKLHVVSGLLQLGKFDEAISFIVNVVSVQQHVFDTLRSNIQEPDIAALILAKMNEAQEANITFRMAEDAYLPQIRPEVVDSVITILGNLLQNAIESLHRSPGFDKIIDLDISLTNKKLVLSVSDNGSGLLPEIRERLFTYGTTSKTGGKNMGIGLHLVKMHTEMLGGEVTVLESDGVTMMVKLNALSVLAKESQK